MEFQSIVLTLRRGEEVKEGVVGNRLGDCPHRAAALVLLFLLDCFQCDILALCPGNRATRVKRAEGRRSKISIQRFNFQV